MAMAKMIYRFRWWRAEHVGHEVCHLAAEWFIVSGWEIAANRLLLALCFEHDLSSNFLQSQETARKLSSKVIAQCANRRWINNFYAQTIEKAEV